MLELLQYEFMRNAFIATLLVSLASGIVGVYVVVKRLVFISGGITHAAFGGIGIGYWLGIQPALVALPFSLTAAITIGVLEKKIRISEDSAIGIIWALGMAIGIIFIGMTPGYVPDLIGYLFGSILTVSKFDLLIMTILDGIILLVCLLFYKEIKAVLFDEEFAAVVGIPTKLVYFLFLALIALSVMVLIRLVGAILLIALLTIPAVIARQFTHRLRNMMIIASFVSAIFTSAGLIISYYLSWPSGATIVLLLSGGFLFISQVKRFLADRKKYRKNENSA